MDRKIGVITVVMILMIFLGVGKYVFAEDIIENETIECDVPDGEEGYYITKPTVYVYHRKEHEITKILFRKPDGENIEKILKTEENESLCIDEMWFTEGKHLLEVWQENENGEAVEGTKIVKEFWVDTRQPTSVKFIYEKEEKDVIFFSKNTFVEVSVEDDGSGIKELCYRLENGEEIRKETEHLIVELPLNYEGGITAWAVDKAGNKGEEVVSKYVITENQAPEIQVLSKEDLGIWHSKEVDLNIRVKEKGIISGIAKIKCYVNGKLVKEKKNLSPFTAEEQIAIVVKNRAEVVVEAEDYAGNISSLSEHILVDTEKPKIDIEGIYDRMIIGKEVQFSCVAEDNQLIKSAQINIRWQNENGKEVSLESAEWKKNEKIWEMNETLINDGIYYIEIQAVDVAGNIITQKYQIVIDKTNPLIRYVGDLHGKYLQIFKWKYDLSDMILDFTNYTYEIRLDGKLKNMQIIEKNEGKHVFTVQATDAAGNASEARAEFIIDHTKPVILFEGIENGGNYEERAEVRISTEKRNDRIAEIWVNGEKQEIRSKILFDEIGKYELFVKAEDLAGNEATERIDFEIKKQEKNALRKIFYSPNKMEDKKTMDKKENMSGVYVICGLVITGGIFFGIIYKKKTSYKREDAG